MVILGKRKMLKIEALHGSEEGLNVKKVSGAVLLALGFCIYLFMGFE